ncbi:hypothetical protein TSTA_125090 [Talaromyces stipitatus ATCC 10500]|uniref:Azaphilone pigments biosynthesis cluster protein L N-terminal domain-containing protein n=1 Tax=Talaromyces stipitatus (strain ATCC 10500 / CBS 375.48 / QM 6759 / NRRL 1006) TaxID=441959 RepID=B8MCH5_TALSN|nr:uncharacterized protein TSTA_125090 [Talaromyces stipitatus ATCC 10500]EED18791.1 hypothetical protein TSTA_125090 [Talaromyces stipitatus ATCC 10500]
MEDGLSAAALLGATTTTLQQVQSLYTTIDNTRAAPDALQSIKSDLQAITLVLHNTACTWPCDSPQSVAIAAEVTATLGNCSRICTDFQVLLTRWEFYSVENNTFWMNQWRQSFSGQERTAAFKGQLNLCKDTLAVALSTVSIELTPRTPFSIAKLRRQEELMSEIKEMSLKQNETVLQKEIDRADSERTETENALREYSIEGSNRSSEESKKTEWNLLKDIQQRQELNDAFRRVCEQSLAITMSARKGPKTEDLTKLHPPQILTGVNTSTEATPLVYPHFGKKNNTTMGRATCAA